MIGVPPLAGAVKVTTSARSAAAMLMTGASGVPFAVTDEVFEAALTPASFTTRRRTG